MASRVCGGALSRPWSRTGSALIALGFDMLMRTPPDREPYEPHRPARHFEFYLFVPAIAMFVVAVLIVGYVLITRR